MNILKLGSLLSLVWFACFQIIFFVKKVSVKDYMRILHEQNNYNHKSIFIKLDTSIRKVFKCDVEISGRRHFSFQSFLLINIIVFVFGASFLIETKRDLLSSNEKFLQLNYVFGLKTQLPFSMSVWKMNQRCWVWLLLLWRNHKSAGVISVTEKTLWISRMARDSQDVHGFIQVNFQFLTILH